MRNIVVTGGSRGIGLAIARRLTSAGNRVIVIARERNPTLDATVSELASMAGAGAVEFHPFDLNRVKDIGQLVKDIRRKHGPIFGLVNNAGIGTSGILTMMPDADIERLIRLNTLAPVLFAKYVVRSMMLDGAGRIVNMSSIVSTTGYSGLCAYSASKAALIGFTRSLAREVGPAGINVNAVAPGFIATEMTSELSAQSAEQIIRRSALRRPIGVDDVADAVEFLLSDQAKNITGTVLTVDAGNTA